MATKAKLIERYLNIPTGRKTVSPEPALTASITGSHFESASCQDDFDSRCRAVPGESPETAPKIAHVDLNTQLTDASKASPFNQTLLDPLNIPDIGLKASQESLGFRHVRVINETLLDPLPIPDNGLGGILRIAGFSPR